MNTAPALTVLMSVYNGAEYLSAAMDSILNQSFADFEFLIIDDGSEEPVGDVIAAYRDDRIRFIRQRNLGLTATLNRGIGEARAALIARMDADDISLPGRFEAQTAALSRDPALVMVGADFDIVDRALRLIEHKRLIRDPIYRLWRLQFHNNYGHGTMMAPTRALIDAGRYDENLRFAQDYDLWSRMADARNTFIVPDTLYLYRYVEKSGQASVKNEAAQLRAAAGVSARSMRISAPDLTEDECSRLRALHWPFESGRAPSDAVPLIPRLFVGFCRRFRIEFQDKARLARLVGQDVAESIQNRDLPDAATTNVLRFLRKEAERDFP